MYHCVEIRHLGCSWCLDYFLRPGEGPALLFLHGLGGSAAHFEAATRAPALLPYTLVGLNFPGSGGSAYRPDVPLGMRDLVQLTRACIESLGLCEVVPVGHSMGGLVALLLAMRDRGRVAGLVSVEGNLAPEDCAFVSRCIARKDRRAVEEDLLPGLRAQWATAENAGLRRYAADLETVDLDAFCDYCRSIVDHSDHAGLFQGLLGLGVPVQFIYGSENAGLSYLPALTASGTAVDEVPDSNHFPFIDAPDYFYDRIGAFISARISASSAAGTGP